MVQSFTIASLKCSVCRNPKSNIVTYILYPIDYLESWMENAALKFNTSIVGITGMDWDNDLTPWPEKGVPKGSDDFKGLAADFLKTIQDQVIPGVEKAMGLTATPVRNLIGVSLSGLFTLWQWLQCDTFFSIASLSGSFWYKGFPEWVESVKLTPKSGKGVFLLGDTERKSGVPEFETVETNTRTIIDYLQSKGYDVSLEMVPGGHYTDPLPRLNRALDKLYS